MKVSRGSDARSTVAFFDGIAAHYSALYDTNTPSGYSFTTRRQRVLDLFDAQGGNVLDVGCGPGVMAGALSELGCTFWGVDPSPRMVDAGRRSTSSRSGVHFSVGAAESLAFDDGFFDAVISMGVLERVADDQAALKEMARVLKPGGSLIISVPNRFSPALLWRNYVFYPLVALLRPVYRRIRRVERHDVIRGHRRYDRRTFAATLARHGCEVTDVGYCVYNAFLPPLDSLFPALATASMRRAEALHETFLGPLGKTLVVKAKKRVPIEAAGSGIVAAKVPTGQPRGAGVRQTGALVRQYSAAFVRSIPAGYRQRALFDDVDTYCMFIGYPRSGHSLVGSLLDAHRNIVIAHELDALSYIATRFSRNQLYSLILENSRRYGTARRDRNYDYSVPDQWQGRWDQIRVIGDKKGGHSTMRIMRRPDLLDRLRRTTGIKTKFVHVIRNPFDNISTMYNRSVSGETLESCIAWYFARCETILDIKQRTSEADMADIRHEDLIVQPESNLRDLCQFFGLEGDPAYLRACASIVFPAPKRTRDSVSWFPRDIADVERRIAAFEFLDGYSFVA